MVEHNLSVVADLSDWITVMQRGKVLATATIRLSPPTSGSRSAYMGMEEG